MKNPASANIQKSARALLAAVLMIYPEFSSTQASAARIDNSARSATHTMTAFRLSPKKLHVTALYAAGVLSEDRPMGSRDPNEDFVVDLLRQVQDKHPGDLVLMRLQNPDLSIGHMIAMPYQDLRTTKVRGDVPLGVLSISRTGPSLSVRMVPRTEVRDAQITLARMEDAIVKLSGDTEYGPMGIFAKFYEAALSKEDQLALLHKPIDKVLVLSADTLNALKDIPTTGRLVRLTRADLKHMGLPKKSIAEIMNERRRAGLPPGAGPLTKKGSLLRIYVQYLIENAVPNPALLDEPISEIFKRAPRGAIMTSYLSNLQPAGELKTMRQLVEIVKNNLDAMKLIPAPIIKLITEELAILGLLIPISKMP